MGIIEKAFRKLYPEREFNYESRLKYSGKFNSYNGNIRLWKNKIQISMSKKWKKVDTEIKIGLIQELMNKLFKTKIKTNNVDLYNIFMKKIGDYTEKNKTDPILENSFDGVNEKYFYGLIDKTNFEWCNSANRLGSYDFGTDTITITKLLKSHPDLLDYVMYHEMLHKKMKYDHNRKNITHHTYKFRKREKEFENSEEMEKRIRGLRKKRVIFRLF